MRRDTRMHAADRLNDPVRPSDGPTGRRSVRVIGIVTDIRREIKRIRDKEIER